jgi:hypothetical protein
MSNLRQLNKTDVLFVAGENWRTYHHTAGLVILEKPAKSRLDFDRFRNRFRTFIGSCMKYPWAWIFPTG